MALGNILINGSYGVISFASIDKNEKVVSIKFDLYEDDTKDELLFSKMFNLSCNSMWTHVKSASKEAPDESEVAGDCFFVPLTATGSWTQYAGKIIHYYEFEETLLIRTDDTWSGQIIFDETAGKYYVIFNSKVKDTVVGSPEIWTEYFDYSVSTAAGTNLIKQCYEFLKTTHFASSAVNV